MITLPQNTLAEICGGTTPVATWPTPESHPVDTWQLELLLQQLAQQEQDLWRKIMQNAAD